MPMGSRKECLLFFILLSPALPFVSPSSPEILAFDSSRVLIQSWTLSLSKPSVPPPLLLHHILCRKRVLHTSSQPNSSCRLTIEYEGIEGIKEGADKSYIRDECVYGVESRTGSKEIL